MLDSTTVAHFHNRNRAAWREIVATRTQRVRNPEGPVNATSLPELAHKLALLLSGLSAVVSLPPIVTGTPPSRATCAAPYTRTGLP